MKKHTFIKILGITALSALCAFGIVACNGSGGASGGVAATVNGTDIMEDEVTASVQNVRDQLDLNDDSAWGTWMAENGYTPQTVREEVIEGFVNQELIRQGAKDRGVEVTDEEVQSYVDSMRSRYDSDEAWQAALETAGITEDEYRENIELSLLAKDIQDSFADEEAVTDEDLLSAAQTYASSYDGARRSSHILFDSADRTLAEEVLNRINSGELDFAEAAKQYSQDEGSAENGGDVGWDALTTFVTEYQTALDGLEKGEVSGLVDSDYGIHIIKCTDIYTSPEELTSLDQLPDEFVEVLRSMLASGNSGTAYTEWLDAQRDAAEVVINEMPEGLPYDIDMTPYESAATQEADDEAVEDQVDTDLALETDGTVVDTEDGNTSVTDDVTEGGEGEAAQGDTEGEGAEGDAGEGDGADSTEGGTAE